MSGEAESTDLTPSAFPQPTRTLGVGGIEVHLFGDGGVACPVVFVTHGRMGKVSDVFNLCRMVANGFQAKGRRVIAAAVEERNHGKRLLDKKLNGGWDVNPDHHIDMWNMQIGMAHDISFLIDALPLSLGWEPPAWAMVGLSLGGHATLITMVKEPRINVGVSLIGCGDYQTLMRGRAAQHGKRPEDIFSDAFLNLLRRLEPVQNVDAFQRRPLLMANGADDKLVPKTANEVFVNKMRATYSSSTHSNTPRNVALQDADFGGEDPALRFSYVEHGQVRHKVTRAMEEDTVAWLLRWFPEVPLS